MTALEVLSVWVGLVVGVFTFAAGPFLASLLSELVGQLRCGAVPIVCILYGSPRISARPPKGVNPRERRAKRFAVRAAKRLRKIPGGIPPPAQETDAGARFRGAQQT